MAKTKDELLKEGAELLGMSYSPRKEELLQEGKLILRTQYTKGRSQETGSVIEKAKQQTNLLAQKQEETQRFALDSPEDIVKRDQQFAELKALETEYAKTSQQAKTYMMGKRVLDDKVLGTGFLDTARANIAMGQFGQDSGEAWSAYMSNPTPEKKKWAEDIDLASRVYAAKQSETLFDTDEETGESTARGNWLSKDIAQHMPQFAKQTKAQAAGQLAAIAAGYATGGALYAPVARLMVGAGSAAHSFQVMRGHAFKDLLDLGVPEEIALKIANEEGVISGAIESASSLLGMELLGFGGLFEAIGKLGVEQVAKIAAKPGMEAVAKGSLKKIATALAKYGINILAEGAEEFSQELVSMRSEKRGLEAIGQKREVPLKEDMARAFEAAKGGMIIGAVMGGAEAAVAQTGTYIVNQTKLRQQQQMAAELDKKIKAAETKEEAEKYGLYERGLQLLKGVQSKEDADMYRAVGDKGSEVLADMQLKEKGLMLESKSEFARAYEAGLQSSLGFEEVLGEQAFTDKSRAEKAFAAAQKDRTQLREIAVKKWENSRQKILETRKEFAESKNIGLLQDEHTERLSEQTKKAIDIIAKQAKVKVVLAPGVVSVHDETGLMSSDIDTGIAYEDMKDFGLRPQDAFYDKNTNTVFVDVKTSNPERNVVFAKTIHEISHAIKQSNPEGYSGLENVLWEGVVKRHGVKPSEANTEIIDKFRRLVRQRYGIEYTREVAKEEIIAREAEALFNSPDTLIKRLDEAGLYTSKRGFVQKVIDAFKSAINKIKERVALARLNKDEKSAYQENLKVLESARDKWVEALKDVKGFEFSPKKEETLVRSVFDDIDGQLSDEDIGKEPMFSLTGEDELLKRLEKENKLLRVRYEYFKNQLKKTHKETDLRKVDSFVEKLLKDNPSIYSKEDLSSNLADLYELVLATSKAKGKEKEDLYSATIETAKSLSEEIANNYEDTITHFEDIQTTLTPREQIMSNYPLDGEHRFYIKDASEEEIKSLRNLARGTKIKVIGDKDYWRYWASKGDEEALAHVRRLGLKPMTSTPKHPVLAWDEWVSDIQAGLQAGGLGVDQSAYETMRQLILFYKGEQDQVRPTAKYEERFAKTADDIANEVAALTPLLLEGFEETRVSLTFADKQAILRKKETEAAKTKYRDRANERVMQVQQQTDKKIAEIRKTTKERADEQITKFKEVTEAKTSAKILRIRDQAEKKIARIEAREKAHKDTMIKRAYERIEASKLRKSVHTQINRLTESLEKPTSKRHMPKNMEGVIADLLAVVKPMEKGRLATEKDKLKLLGIATTFRSLDQQNEGDAYVMDTELPDNLTELASLLEKKSFTTQEPGKRMNPKDLKLLNDTLAATIQFVKIQNQILGSEHNKEIGEITKQIGRELKAEASYQKKAFVEPLRTMLAVDMLAPADFAERLGPTFKKIYDDGIRRGLDKKISLIAFSQKYMEEVLEGVNVSEWSGPKAKLVDVFGMKMTPAQLMSLYALTKQEASVTHMLNGGVVPVEVTTTDASGIGKAVPRIITTYKPVAFTEAMIAKIPGLLTEQQKAVANAVSAFFVEEVSKWGNEVSQKMYGYDKFTERNYFPIVSDPNFLLREVLGQPSEHTLKNMGSTKQRQAGASNPILIEDVFSVFARHVDSYSSYNAFVPALSDLQRIFNGVAEEGTIKGLIEQKYGRRMQGYYRNLVRDINGGTRLGPSNPLVKKLISNYKGAVIGMNLRVVAQQPTTLVRAAAMIDPAYLIAGLNAKDANWDIVKHYAPIAQWKDWGYFTLDVGRQLEGVLTGQETLKDKTMDLIEAADRFAWIRLWKAVELETNDLFPELVGEDYYNHVGLRFSDIVDRTQVVDTTLHRTGMMRGDDYTKVITSFMAEPMKNYNLLLSTYRNYSENRTEESKRAMRRAQAAFVATVLLNSVITGLYDVWRGKKEPDENLVESFARNMAENVISDPFEMIPLVRDLYGLFVEGYPVKRMDMQLFEKVKYALTALTSDKRTKMSGLYDLVSAVLDLSGIPAGSATREVKDMFRNSFEVTGYYEALFVMKSFEYRIDNPANASKFIDILFSAHKAGDEAGYENMVKKLLDNGVSISQIQSGMRSRYKKIGKVPVEFEGKTTIPNVPSEEKEKIGVDTLTNKQALQYSNSYKRHVEETTENVKQTSIYKNGSSELKTRIENAVKDYAKSYALTVATKGEYTETTTWLVQMEIAKTFMTPENFIVFIEGRKDYGKNTGASGITQEETRQYMDLQGYGTLTKSALWSILYPNSANPYSGQTR